MADDTVVPLGVWRWNASDSNSPADYSIRDMLVMALHRLDSGDYPADHMILIIGVIHEDRSVDTQMMQAGPFDNFAQLGLMTQASRGFLEGKVWP